MDSEKVNLEAEKKAIVLREAVFKAVESFKDQIKLLATNQAQMITDDISSGFPVDFPVEMKSGILASMREMFISGATFGFDEVVDMILETQLSEHIRNTIAESYRSK